MPTFKNFEEATSHINKTLQESTGISTLFPEKFMNKHTRFSSFMGFISDGGFTCNNQDDFDKLNSPQMDAYVSKITHFKSWAEFLTASVVFRNSSC